MILDVSQFNLALTHSKELATIILAMACVSLVLSDTADGAGFNAGR